MCVDGEDGEDGEDGSGEGVRVTVEGGESTTIPQLENEVNIYIEVRKSKNISENSKIQHKKTHKKFFFLKNIIVTWYIISTDGSR